MQLFVVFNTIKKVKKQRCLYTNLWLLLFLSRFVVVVIVDFFFRFSFFVK